MDRAFHTHAFDRAPVIIQPFRNLDVLVSQAGQTVAMFSVAVDQDTALSRIDCCGHMVKDSRPS